ncbi:hypothetical protein SAMN03159318_00381 [Pseudomonas sp. NFACC42-2]|nr:hypothetical protein SAMN03159318_00381 [Pseudomonas sp. NFACC42-2]
MLPQPANRETREPVSTICIILVSSIIDKSSYQNLINARTAQIV